MNLLPNRSKQYVTILLGGHPTHADRVMELVADKQRRLSFIYGFNIFVVYFYSKKSIKDIEDIFLTTLKDQVDMIFVFPTIKKAVQYMAPHLKLKMEDASSERNNMIGSDMKAFRDVLTAIGNRMPYTRQVSPVEAIPIPPREVEENSLSDNDILNELLTKMKNTGYSSLSPAELDFLKSYKDKHRKDNQNNENDVD
jgi:hypothetical protein